MRNLSLEEQKLLFEESARFSNFCQKFKMEYWQMHPEYKIPEERLDELAMLAFKLLK